MWVGRRLLPLLLLGCCCRSRLQQHEDVTVRDAQG
jgi:hypothetical protein